MTDHEQNGNCWEHECPEVVNAGICDVCHDHDEPRGECSECPPCKECEDE